ncbi:MarR family transcriptional regulator [Frankia sp. AgB1.9]|uniref:MarR family winged helix-turn-helix transcriptional regulator n=1 Tax=unclassified Frankia TaxID=2632575 RepID=UPI001932BC84|nr:MULTISPECIES: MarR family transcriptional regulator [unclassified Frankia]MBL7493534.1 MarR family transcriptional regulator [Frankia sp. AgW1.1]MBL7551677.1 MarR family transcriptional regulator [Frankia sp. AgB1.9]MBL7620213.1 MarR family transcriptional regulator [Frankia sp. AgB1.8]
MPAHHEQSGRIPDRVRDRPTWLISRAFARSTSLLFAGFETHGDGLRGYHYRLLAALEQWGPASQADLGRDTGIDRSDVTGALTELEARGLVERRPDPDHGRRKIVTITPLGLDALRRLDGVIDGIQEAVLAPLTAQQRRQFVDLISRLGDAAMGGEDRPEGGNQG